MHTHKEANYKKRERTKCGHVPGISDINIIIDSGTQHCCLPLVVPTGGRRLSWKVVVRRCGNAAHHHHHRDDEKPLLDRMTFHNHNQLSLLLQSSWKEMKVVVVVVVLAIDRS